MYNMSPKAGLLEETKGGWKEEKREGIKENDGGGDFNMMYLIYCKNFCKYHNVPLA
jgi:hypothetical protein